MPVAASRRSGGRRSAKALEACRPRLRLNLCVCTAGPTTLLRMPHATAFALNLDEEMLGRHGVAVAPPFTPDHALPVCVDLAGQLGGRYLIKYVRSGDHHQFRVPHVTT